MKNLLLSSILTGLTLLFAQDSEADGVKPSVWVYPDSTYGPNLLYGTDTNGVRLNDFSECGYKRGQVELPNVTNLVEQSRWIYLNPAGGGVDDGPTINAALTLLGILPANTNGFRGVVFLAPGAYTVTSTSAIRITNSGVILKGAGPSTMLYAPTSSPPFTLIQVEGSGDRFIDPNVEAWLMELLVPAGTRTFRVDATNGFSVGDSVAIHHHNSASWLHANDMDKLGQPWQAGDYDTDYERIITRLEGNWMTVDTPIPQTFESRFSYGHLAHVSGPNRVQNCGVEDLYCSAPLGTEDEGNPNSAVRFLKASDCWVRGVVAQGFFSSAVSVGGFSKFVTVAECENVTDNLDYLHFRYSFYLEKSDEPEYVLMRDCYSYNSRHSFIVGSVVPGPNAFVRCDASYSSDESGPHERWSTGTLLDEVRELGGQFISISGHEIGVENRGNSGGGSSYQGWTAGYTAVWNCYAEDGFRVRNPPTARNWLIGSNGELKSSPRGCWYSFIPLWPDGDCWAVGADPDGTYDQSGPGAPLVQLHSLYYAQLQQRLLFPGSQFREYRLGDINQFYFSPGVDYQIPLDTNWMAQVQQSYNQGTVPGPMVTNLFDSAGPNQATAFTFYVPSYSNEQVVAASLTLSLHFSAIGATFGHNLSIGTTANSYDVGSLGWTDISTNGTYSHTIPIDPALINGGELNLALGPYCGVDFAVLNLQAAPIIPTSTVQNPSPPFNTFVQGGSTADQNFSGDTELLVKVDPTPDYQRRAFLNWNLAEVTGTVVDAKVQLYCKEADEAGNEKSAAVVPDNSWSPFTVTWNTQPATSPPFAYWVPQPGQFSQFDVTPQVAAALAGATKEISFCIDSAADWGSQGGVAYGSSRDPDSTHWPQLILCFSISPPFISGPTNVSIGYNRSLTLPVTIGDAGTDASSLTLVATSSVPSVVSVTSVGGAGSNRTVTIKSKVAGIHPTAGYSVITLQVSDGLLSASTSFVVDVGGGTEAPSISQIAN